MTTMFTYFWISQKVLQLCLPSVYCEDISFHLDMTSTIPSRSDSISTVSVTAMDSREKPEESQPDRDDD